MGRSMTINLPRSGKALAALVLAGTKPAEAAFPGKNGKIVFSSLRTTGDGVDNPTGDYEIFTMNPGGTGVTQLTRNTAYDYQPAFSADGTKMAFFSDRDEQQGEIYVMTAVDNR
jgi:Tol biopolymer transport system component